MPEISKATPDDYRAAVRNIDDQILLSSQDEPRRHFARLVRNNALALSPPERNALFRATQIALRHSGEVVRKNLGEVTLVSFMGVAAGGLLVHRMQNGIYSEPTPQDDVAAVIEASRRMATIDAAYAAQIGADSTREAQVAQSVAFASELKARAALGLAPLGEDTLSVLEGWSRRIARVERAQPFFTLYVGLLLEHAREQEGGATPSSPVVQPE